MTKGIGIWGNNQPVGWAFPIINFVWWIGIGHAGTLISAILLLLNQKWRTSINRFAEAMTLVCRCLRSGCFRFSTRAGRGLAYWLFPYPNTMGIWPQFRSPLMWDVFAVSTYATCLALFWYVGLIPDLATLRDRAKNKYFKFVYAILSWGWRGQCDVTGTGTRSLTCCSRASRRRWCFPYTRSCHSTSRCRRYRAGMRLLPTVLRCGCDLTRDSRWF